MIPKYAAKRDDSERAIIDALEAAYVSVWQLNQPGMPDLLCVPKSRPWWCARPDTMTREQLIQALERLLAERVVLQECKSGPYGKLTKAQQANFERGLPFQIVRHPFEALHAVGVHHEKAM